MSAYSAAAYDVNPFAEVHEDETSFVTPFVSKPSGRERDSNLLGRETNLPPPKWLQSGNSAEDLKPQPQPQSFSSSTAAPSPVPTQTEVSNEVPRFLLYTRVINLILSVCMILVSVLALLTTQTATTGVLACYVVVFSCLLCCFETHLKQVSKLIALNFGFMYSAKSRSVFMMFIGTILFSFNLFGKVIGVCMLANAGFNCYIIFRYPEYEKIQRDDALSEIKGFLAANPAFAKTMVDAGVSASSEIIRNNPEIARKGAEALVFGRSSASNGDYANV